MLSIFMKDKITTVRYIYKNNKLEIIVKADLALKYKTGKNSNILSLLVSDEIYCDSKKGTRVSTNKLYELFKTRNTIDIIKKILTYGDLNLTTEQRRNILSQKRNQIIEFIVSTFIDPRTGLPHPRLRIERAMDDTRVVIDPNKNINEQIKNVIEKIRSIVALKTENLKLKMIIPSKYAAQSYHILKINGNLIKNEYDSNGSLKAILEIQAAIKPILIDKLNAITKGTALIEVTQ